MSTMQLSTAAAAEFFAALTIFSPPTTSPIPASLEQPVRPTQKISSRLVPTEFTLPGGRAVAIQTTLAAVSADMFDSDAVGRPTTLHETIIGELRRWNLLEANWDGEGAERPVSRSLQEAVSFVRLLSDWNLLPEPMLHADGHAGLFWKNDGLYADVEFLGDGRIAYYIERQGDKHKGVLKFDTEKLPAVFPTLLQS